MFFVQKKRIWGKEIFFFQIQEVFPRKKNIFSVGGNNIVFFLQKNNLPGQRESISLSCKEHVVLPAEDT